MTTPLQTRIGSLLAMATAALLAGCRGEATPTPLPRVTPAVGSLDASAPPCCTPPPATRFTSATAAKAIPPGELLRAEVAEDEALATATPWLEPARRPSLATLDVPMTDQDGRVVPLSDLVDRPTVVSFFYTRCDNPYKCTRTVTDMARLQHALEEAGLDDGVRLLLITYEPEFDSPGRLKQYGIDRDLRFGPNALALRPDPSRKADLFAALGVAVNFQAGWVNLHGVQLMLIDRRARLARTYHTLAWDDAEVLKDLRTLVRETQ